MADRKPGDGVACAARVCSTGALFVLALVLAMSVYRAATQSVVHDEALTYNWFAGQPLIQMFNYDANHHILHTWLVRLSVSAFGVSELTLRLPALLGAAIYLAALAWLAFRTLPPGPWRLAAVTLGAANPLLLDFFACARGYSLALGFLLLALVLIARHLSGVSSRLNLAGAGLALGLSVASNLAFAFPVAAAAVAFLVFDRHRSPAPRSRADDAAWFVLSMLPGAAILFTCGVPMAALYVGHDSVAAALNDLVNASFFSTETAVLDPLAPVPEIVPRGVALAAGAVVGILLLGGVALFAAKRFRRPTEEPTPAAVGGALLMTVACLAALFILAAHLVAGVKYPVDRTGLYFVPVVTLALALGLASWTRRPKALDWVALALALVVTVGYATQLRVSYFRTWKYDADSRRVFDRMEATVGQRAADSTTVFGAWYYEPSTNFYRLARRASWLRVFPRAIDGPLESCDFLIVDGSGARRMKPLGFVPVYVGDVSDVVLLANAKHGLFSNGISYQEPATPLEPAPNLASLDSRGQKP